MGMAQGMYPMENVTSAKFRIFLAEKAINYLFLGNVKANVLLTNTNIGCPNISFGPGICSLFFLFLLRDSSLSLTFSFIPVPMVC